MPDVHLICANSAWSMTPACISGPRMIPAARPNHAAVASEPSPSPSIRVRPPWLTVSVPPPAGFDCTCQKSYSQPVAWSITAMWPSPPAAGRAASGIRNCIPCTSHEDAATVHWTVNSGSLARA